MNLIVRLITTALIAAMAFVAVPAQAAEPTDPPPAGCQVAGSAGCPAPEPESTEPVDSPPPAGCVAAGAAGCPANAPTATEPTEPSPAGCQVTAETSQHDARLSRLQAKVKQLRERLRTR